MLVWLCYQILITRFGGAISRAVRTPSRYEDNGNIPRFNVRAPGSVVNPSPYPAQILFQGNEKMDAENLLAYELGYRFMPLHNFSFDLALFYNQYDDLRSTEILKPYKQGNVLRNPVTSRNKMLGQTYGAELLVDWHPFDWWSIQLAYTYLEMQLKNEDGSFDASAPFVEGSSPEQQLSLRTGFYIKPNLQLNFWLRYVDKLPKSGTPVIGLSTFVEDYLNLDIRITWQPTTYLDFSVVGQNLLAGKHLQIVQEGFGPQPTYTDSSVYVQAKLLF